MTDFKPFHEEERSTIWVLEAYEDEHPNTTYVVTFKEGDSYLSVFDTEFEDSTDCDEGDPRFDEFMTIWMRVERVIKLGTNCDDINGPNGLIEHGMLDLNYRHFPVRITTEDGTVVYRKEE